MKRYLRFVLTLVLISPITPANSDETDFVQYAEEYIGGYDRKLFKHWVDADKNGCDTRKEVLIAEATIKPKIGAKCVLSGGTWVSSYDNKTFKGSGSGLDVDHMVPLAEAWRSGAWQWTSEEREKFANDLQDERVLIAVSATSNRSKSDKDPANWLPKGSKEAVCDYVFNWAAVKYRFSLTIDPKERKVIERITLEPSCADRHAQTMVKPLIQFQKYISKSDSKPTPSETQVAPTPTPSKSLPKAVKYKNCTEVKNAGVAPILKSTNPELYELNKGLDRDKDGDACE
jgi:hypothetical protein